MHRSLDKKANQIPDQVQDQGQNQERYQDRNHPLPSFTTLTCTPEGAITITVGLSTGCGAGGVGSNWSQLNWGIAYRQLANPPHCRKSWCALAANSSASLGQ